MARIKDNPNKVKAKLIVEVEAEFYDNESSEDTLRYCVEQDLEDAGFNVIDVSVMKWDYSGRTSYTNGKTTPLAYDYARLFGVRAGDYLE